MTWRPRNDRSAILRAAETLGLPRPHLNEQQTGRGLWTRLPGLGRHRPGFGDHEIAVLLDPKADAQRVQQALRAGATYVVTREGAAVAPGLLRILAADIDQSLVRQPRRAARVLGWLARTPFEPAAEWLEPLQDWAKADRAVLVALQGGGLRMIADSRGEHPAGAWLDAGHEIDVRMVAQTGRPQLVDPNSAAALRALLRIPGDTRLRLTLPILGGTGVVAVLRLEWRRLPDKAAARGIQAVIAACRRLSQIGATQGTPPASREELRQLELVFNQAGDGLLVVDREAVIQRISRRLLSMLGYTKEDVIGRTVLDFAVEADRPLLAQYVHRLQAGDFRERRWPLRLRRKDGTPHPFEVGVEPLAGMGGSVIVVLHDQSALQALNQALSEAKLYLENVIQSSPDAIIAADLRGRISLFNPSAQRMTGWTKELLEERGEGIERFYPIDEARRVMMEMRRDLAAGGAGVARNLRTHLIARDGQRIPILINAALLRDASGTISGSVGIFTDLRQMVAVEQALLETRQQLIQSEREAAVAALAGAAAHHLNQPLTAVIGYAELLRRRHPELNDDPALARIEEAAARMAELVREIGRITRFEVRRYAEGEEILAIDPEEPAE